MPRGITITVLDLIKGLIVFLMIILKALIQVAFKTNRFSLDCSTLTSGMLPR